MVGSNGDTPDRVLMNRGQGRQGTHRDTPTRGGHVGTDVVHTSSVDCADAARQALAIIIERRGHL
jgi:hypothetical protein